MADNHDFCRFSLSQSRQSAKDEGVALPRVSSSKMHEENYAVFIGDDFYEEYSSCCAFGARSRAIDKYADQRMKAKGDRLCGECWLLYGHPECKCRPTETKPDEEDDQVLADHSH